MMSKNFIFNKSYQYIPLIVASLLHNQCVSNDIADPNSPSIEDKPLNMNVLFIAIDDLNDWVGFMDGHPDVKTPNMDRLASQGMVFANAYCNTAISNPSRTALLTGIKPTTSGIYNNSAHYRESPVLKDVVTLPQYFHDNGYITMRQGKIFHNTPNDWADRDSSTWDIDMKSSSSGVIFDTNLDDMPTFRNGISKEHSDVVYIGGIHDWGSMSADTKSTYDYNTCTLAAEQLLKEYDKPFFLACGISKPHLPWYVPQKYFDLYPVDGITHVEYNEADLDDLSAIGRRATDIDKTHKESWYQLVKLCNKREEATQAYLACISYVDDCVGVILDAWQKSPHKDNTIVVLFSDHGFHVGDKAKYGKATLWENSCNAPLIVIAPGITKAGSRCTTPVSFTDIYPTLLELADLEPNSKNEGESILPLLRNPRAKWDRPAITSRSNVDHTVRSKDFRYIQYRDGSEELYDHRVDPTEWNNLAKDSKYNDVIQELKKHIPKNTATPIKQI